MAQQASLKIQSATQALAVLSQLNHVPQHHQLHVESQLLTSETTVYTEVISPLSEVQINWSTEVITLETQHPAYHLLLKLSFALLNDRLYEWRRGSTAQKPLIRLDKFQTVVPRQTTRLRVTRKHFYAKDPLEASSTSFD